jgi:hypothetical protein
MYPFHTYISHCVLYIVALKLKQNLELRLKKLFQLQIEMEDIREYSEEEIKDSDDQLFTVSFNQQSKIKVEEYEYPSDQPSSATHKEQAEFEMEDNSNDPLSFDDCVKQENEKER